MPTIGRKRPDDHLADIVIDRATFLHGGDDRGEIVVEQHHLRCLLGGLRALAAHRDANIGLFQRRRVIDPVTGHRDDIAIGLQGAHDAELVLRTGARKNADVLGQLAQPVVRHPVELRPGDHLRVIGQGKLPCDGGGGVGMIAGNHLHRNPGRPAIGNRRDRFVARRVDEPDDAQKHQPAGKPVKRQPFHLRRGGHGGKAQHPLAIARRRGDTGLPIGRIGGGVLAFGLFLAHLQHALRRALHGNPGSAVGCGMERCHEAVLRVEGYLIAPRPGSSFGLGMQPRFHRQCHQRPFHRVAVHAPASVAVQQIRVVAQQSGAYKLG